MKDNAKVIWNYVKEHEAENITAQNISDATGIPKKTVDPTITAAFCRKDRMVRVDSGEVAVNPETGKATLFKYIKITDAYKNATVEDLEKEDLERAAEKAAAKAAAKQD